MEIPLKDFSGVESCFLFQYEGQAVYPEVKPYKPAPKYPAL